MQLDEFFAAACEMVKRGVDPQRMREELECAIRISTAGADARVSFAFDLPSPCQPR